MKPLLSIVCITYNHEKFLKQTLDSFLTQKTTFPYEVIISDDCSTDSTSEILKEYEKKHPNIFKIFYQEKNLGPLKNYIFALSQVKTEYVVINEGDDYFTDPYKLQKQVDFLDSHSEYSGCFHPVKVVWENGEKKDSIYPSKKKMRGRKFVTKEDLLRSNYIQTNSVVYRWRFIEESIQDYFPDGILPGDLYLHLLHAQVGNIAFLLDIMAVYRKNEGGIWFDEKNRNIKYGLAQVNFYYNVWKNFTDSSEKYLNKKFLPFMKEVSDVYYQNQVFDKLEILKDTYGELYLKALKIEEKNSNKYKKYKKLSNSLIIILIIQFIVILFYYLNKLLS